MKRTTIFLAALALVAASCTKTEVVSDKTQDSVKGIGFSAYTSRPTKAAQEDVTTANLSSFQVTAIGNNALYFNNINFAKNAETSFWESNPVYFWPAYKLSFYAYNTPTNGTFTRNITKDAQTLTFSPSTKLDEQEDLVAASALNQSEPTGATQLNFNHYLTQIIVKAKNSNQSYTVQVDSVKIANFAGEGTYDFTDMIATTEQVNTNESIDYRSGFSTTKTLSAEETVMMNDTGKGRWYLVPQRATPWVKGTDNNTANGTYVGLKVRITSPSPSSVAIYPAKGEGTAWMAIPVSESPYTFEQGKKYSIVLDFFSEAHQGAGYVDPEEPGDLDGDGVADNDKGKAIVGGAIKFNATVEAWPAEIVIRIEL